MQVLSYLKIVWLTPKPKNSNFCCVRTLNMTKHEINLASVSKQIKVLNQNLSFKIYA
jgi:hypothetical protein